MSEAAKGVSFEQIEKVASEMIVQGVKPTVRGIMAVSGGKTEVVSKHLRDFFEKRDNEVAKMADELGSSNIAKLIASEMQVVVGRRTAELQEINQRQKEQIDELVELLEEKVRECEQIRADAQVQVDKVTREASEKVESVKKEASDKVDLANAKAEKAVAAIKQAESETEKALLKAESSVQSAQEKANALVEAANKNADIALREAASLREQVKALSIDAAKREIEKAEFEQQKKAMDQLRIDFAEQKTEVVRMATENRSLQKDLDRLETENQSNRHLSAELAKAQTLYVEAHRQLTDIQNKLSLSERERDSFAEALSRSKKTDSD
jgi:chromosome segregation ATPase